MIRSETRGLRLQVFLARAGRGSRRTMEQAIRDGRVAVDGQVVTTLGVRVDPEVQEVRLDGQRVRPAERPSTVIVIHKPPRVLTTTHDPHGRPTVLRLLPASLRRERLFPVGRLDFASEGLVLLTNDGELAFRLMHPRFGHEREYVVTVRGPEPADLARRLTEGIDIGDRRPARAVRARRVNNDWQVVLTEGRKRQVRRMFEAVGMRVTRLRRVRLGPVTLGDLASGRRPRTERVRNSFRTSTVTPSVQWIAPAHSTTGPDRPSNCANRVSSARTNGRSSRFAQGTGAGGQRGGDAAAGCCASFG